MKATIKLREVKFDIGGENYYHWKHPVAVVGRSADFKYYNIKVGQEYRALSLLNEEVTGTIEEDEKQDQYEDGSYARSSTITKTFKINL